ncbi:MAG: hypothetical protein ACLGGX_06765, partial [Bdellovibrionia bacterium]
SRTRLGSVDLVNGSVNTNWDPFPNSTVKSLKTIGSSLFVSGTFSSIAGNARNYTAIFDSNLNLTSSILKTISYHAFDSDNSNLVGHGFTEDGTNYHLSFYDSSFNLIWRSNSSVLSNYATSLKMSPNNIYLAHSFAGTITLDGNSIPPYSIIKIPRTNTLNISTAWNPQFVNAVTIRPLETSTGLLLVGGNFKGVNTSPRSGFAIISESGAGDPLY